MRRVQPKTREAKVNPTLQNPRKLLLNLKLPFREKLPRIRVNFHVYFPPMNLLIQIQPFRMQQDPSRPRPAAPPTPRPRASRRRG